jgi:hypothetical protein
MFFYHNLYFRTTEKLNKYFNSRTENMNAIDFKFENSLNVLNKILLRFSLKHVFETRMNF